MALISATGNTTRATYSVDKFQQFLSTMSKPGSALREKNLPEIEKVIKPPPRK